MTGNGRENVGRASAAGGARGSYFSARMHEPAVSDGREQERKSELEAKNRRAQAAVRNRYRMARAKSNVVEYPAILAEGDFAFGAAIEVIKHGLRNSFACDGPEIFDANYVG